MARFAASDAIALATQAADAGQRAGDGEVRARALVARGRAHEARGASADALADLTQGSAGARAVADRRLEMLALRELGGDVPVSRGLPITYSASCLESGLRIAESLGDRASQADLLSRLAIITVFAVLVALVYRQDGWAVFVGLVIFQLVMMSLLIKPLRRVIAP